MVLTRFSRINDEELQKYIEKEMPESEREEYDLRKEVSKILKAMDTYNKSLAKNVNDLKLYFDAEKPNPYFIKQEIGKLSNTVRKYVKRIYDVGLYCGCLTKEDRKEIVSEDLTFTQTGEKLHIIFPTLLPRRISQNDSPITSADVKQMYQKSFYEFFCTGKHRMHTDRVMIVYTMIFSNEKEFVDMDNFQTKEVTDLITSWLSLEDDPKHCALCMDYKMGEYSHTEVDVMPYDRFCEYMMEKEQPN